MEDRHQQFNKIDLTPKKWHGYTVFLFILGTLLPPLAVAARFGIGLDFAINLILTICGYIPGHFHNFYIQNIRNNKSNRRTPKWAQRYGLVDTTALERRAKRTQWAGRYNDRLPRSTLEGQAYAEGQETGSSSFELSNENGGRSTRANGDLWRPEDEQFYGQNGDGGSARTSGSGGRWHYPANFEDSVVETGAPKKKKKKEKKDRWARTEDAYSMEGSDTHRRKKKSKRVKSTSGDSEPHSRHSDSVNEFPEDAEGGLYGDRRNPTQPTSTNDEALFSHEF